MIDGHSAYCMNFSLAAKGGQLMTSDENPNTSMSTAQKKLLAYCMYYGYSSTEVQAPTDEQSNQYIATQAMVWIIMEGVFGTDGADSAAGTLCACAPDPDAAYSYYETLRDNIQTSYNAIRPSFASSTKSDATTYELKWNESNQRFEYTFTDTNGVLGNYDFSIDGFSVQKSGNTMTIYTKSVNTTDALGSFSSASGAVDTTSSCVFWLTGNSGDQEFVSERPTADPISAYIKVRTENIGYAEITKTDESSGVKLNGAVYGIYSDSGCTNKVATVTTDANGYAKSAALSAGTYYVKEITTPKGYVLSDKVHTLTVKAGQTTAISATDKEQMGSLTIYKEGEVLTGWNGSNFTYETRKLSGAAFKVTAGADIYKADGTKVYSKGDVVAVNLVTGSNGQVLLTDLHLGTYVVTETKSIDGYTLNTTPQTVTISYKDQNVTVQAESTTVKNSRQKAEVSVVKKDSDTGNVLAGGQYTIYAGNDIVNYAGKVIVTKGTALQTVTTGTDGKAAYGVDLPISNSYYISETKAPYGYQRNESDVYSFSFQYLSETSAKATFSHIFENDRTTAKIHVYKVDKETGLAIPQGDATLEGAVYGLYARDDIVHPDGTTGVLYGAGELITTMKIDGNGDAEVGNLYLGNYYVKEISPSEGYLADEEEHDVICDYEGDLVAEVSRSTTSEEQVIKQPFQLIKVSDNGDDTEAPVLSGAGFTAYLKSSLTLKADGSYDYDSATPVVIGENGETTIYTDEKGYAVTIAIPYGTYVVRETVTPSNMTTIKPFTVKIVENHPTEPQVWRVFLDREFTAKLRIVKKDADTKQTVLVPNAEFKIYNLDTEEYVSMITTYPSKVTHTSFFTDEDGDLILPETLKIGNYRIEEVAAPYGYLLNQDYVMVSVESDTAYEIDPDTYEAIITVDYEDDVAVGELTVEKKGELLDSYNDAVTADLDEKSFVYREGSLAGAKYEVYAAEDIYTADMQTDSDGNRTKYYSEGELVATIVTGDDGKATLKNLPLGQYKVVEVEAPYGYVLNEEAQYVTFTYVDDKTPVIYEGLTLTNDRQTISLSVEKKDSKTDELIAGAVFGLYADGDIVNADGKVIVKAGTLIERAVTGTDGTVTFVSDLPLGKYYVKEIEAPKGYVMSDKVFYADATYQGGEIGVLEFLAEFENSPIMVEISKTDITGEKEIGGAKLSVIDSEGNIVESWTSEAGKTHLIEKLPAGRYILREETAPYGYKKAADVEFEVTETAVVQKVVMKDEYAVGKIVIEKTDETTKKPIAGVEFEIRDKDGNVIETLVTDKNGHAESSRLPICTYNEDGSFKENICYTVVETKAVDGYILDETAYEVVLSYEDDATDCVTYTLSLTNKPIGGNSPQTGDDSNPWLWAGVGLAALIAGLGAFFWKRKDENVIE
jgi:LPXTG-motif cell wall-anchored protein